MELDSSSVSECADEGWALWYLSHWDWLDILSPDSLLVLSTKRLLTSCLLINLGKTIQLWLGLATLSRHVFFGSWLQYAQVMAFVKAGFFGNVTSVLLSWCALVCSISNSLAVFAWASWGCTRHAVWLPLLHYQGSWFWPSFGLLVWISLGASP